MRAAVLDRRCPGVGRFSCGLCQLRCSSQVALRLHYGSAHGQQLHGCRLCGQSFIRLRDLDKHECDEDDPAAAIGRTSAPADQQQGQQRVPPLVVRPPKVSEPPMVCPARGQVVTDCSLLYGFREYRSELALLVRLYCSVLVCVKRARALRTMWLMCRAPQFCYLGETNYPRRIIFE